MVGIERRIAALESKASKRNASFNLVLVAHGETPAQALERGGFAPDAANVMCVVFISPSDARL